LSASRASSAVCTWTGRTALTGSSPEVTSTGRPQRFGCLRSRYRPPRARSPSSIPAVVSALGDAGVDRGDQCVVAGADRRVGISSTLSGATRKATGWRDLAKARPFEELSDAPVSARCARQTR
jgi:hypothetical protein